VTDLERERRMRRAIGLAANGPDRPFGEVIVDGLAGAVVAGGWNRSEENPRLHGEVGALPRLAGPGRGPDLGRLVL
jgi:tRNA(Arg) A34 adenosine deaminase TadA